MTRAPHGVLLVALVMGVSVLLVACGGSGSAGAPITELDGETLFSMRALGNRPGCVTCHSLEPDHVLVGPSLSGIGTRADAQIPDQDGATYIRTSITEPNAHIVAGFFGNKMPTDFAELLSAEQIEALVDYLGGLE